MAKLEQVGGFTCPNCGAQAMVQRNGRTVCGFCGAEFVVQTEADERTRTINVNQHVVIEHQFSIPEPVYVVQGAEVSTQKEKWYKRSGWIIFFLVLFPPVGIVMTWLNENWDHRTKSIASVAAGVWFVFCMLFGGSSSDETTPAAEPAIVAVQYDSDFN